VTRRLVLSYLAIAVLVIFALILPLGLAVQGLDLGDLDPRRAWLSIILISVSVIGSSVALGLIFSRSLRRPIDNLRDASVRLAEGDLDARANENVPTKELRDLAVSFNHMAEELEARIKSQRDFVADASHQLRTPLTALQFQLENLGDTEDPDVLRWRDAALERVSHLARLVEEMLTLARVDSGIVAPAKLQRADAIVSGNIDAWLPVAAEFGSTIEFEPGEAHSLLVLTVPTHVEQILENLVANAARAAPNSTITIRLARAGSNVEFHVVDCGHGMTDAERQRAFDRFWRSAKNANVKGSGLGLAIVQRLAEANHGSVTLEASPCGGTDATLRLPLAGGDDDDELDRDDVRPLRRARVASG
jgi:signal transduction histidine kinase